MACKVEYNREGQPTRVLREDGNESALFKDVAGHPAMGDFESSLNAFKNIYSDKVKGTEDNIRFTNMVDGQEMSYKSALLTNKDIEIGFVDANGEFHKVKTVTPSFDVKTQEGFVNSEIVNEVISEKRLFKNGEIYYQPFGESESARGITADFLREHALINLGWDNYIKDGNGFRFGENIRYKTENLTAEENLIAQEIFKTLEEIENNRDSQREVETNKLSEQELKLSLLQFLDKLGVKALSISDYLNRYSSKHGVDPSAEALADISNKLIAFKNGEISLNALTEEVAHFIEAGIPMAEKANILRNIHRTKEWAQHSERYRETYSKNLKGEELDQAVRREVLGKVLANSMKNNFSNTGRTGIVTNIINKVKELFNNFINNIRGRSNSTLEAELSSLTEKVNDIIHSKNIESLVDVSKFSRDTSVFYSLKGESKITERIRAEAFRAVEMIRTNLRNLNKGDIRNTSDLQRMARLSERLMEAEKEMADADQKYSVSELLSLVSSQANHISKLIEDNKGQEAIVFGTAETTSLNVLVTRVSPILGNIKHNILNDSSKANDSSWKSIVEEIDKAQKNITDIKTQSSDIYTGVTDRIAERLQRQMGFGEDYKDHLKLWLEAAQRDTSVFQRYFGQINQSENPILGMMSHITERTFLGAGREYMYTAKEFMQDMERLNISAKDLGQLLDNGFLISETDQFAQDEFSRRIEAISTLVGLGEMSMDSDARVTYNENIEQRIEEIIKKSDIFDSPILTDAQRVEKQNFRNRMAEKYNERYWKPEYYKEQQERYERLGISKVTQDRINSYSRDRAALRREALDKETGTWDWSKLTESQYERLKNIQQNRSDDKSFVGADGVLKEGISRTTNFTEVPAGAKFVEKKGMYYFLDPLKTPTEEATIAMDLNKLDNEWIARLQEEHLKDRLKLRKEITNDSRSVEDLYKLSKEGRLADMSEEGNAEYRRRVKNIGIEQNTRFLNEVKLIEEGVSENVTEFNSVEEAMNNPSKKDYEGFKVEGRVYVYDSHTPNGYKRAPVKQGRDAALKFIEANSSIVFNDTFWQDLSRDTPLLEMAQTELNKGEFKREYNTVEAAEEATERAKKSIRAIKEMNSERSEIMNRFKNSTRHFETDVNRMPKSAKDRIKQLDADLRYEYLSLTNTLKLERGVFDKISENEANEAYYRALQERTDGSNDSILSFLQSTLDPSSWDAVRKFEDKLRMLNRGEMPDFSNAQQRIISEELLLGSEVDIKEAMIKYAESQLPSYYKRFIPAEYSEVLKQERFLKASTYLETLLRTDYVDVRPNNSFLEETNNDMRNPNFDPNAQGGVQFKKGMFESKKYKELFAPDSQGNPTRNQNLFEIYESLKEIHAETLNNYDLKDRHNAFLAPQIRKRGLERFTSTFKGNARETVMSMFRHRADQLEYGDKIGDTDSYHPPKYYLNRIENQSDVSTDVLFSYMMMHYQSILYKHRKNNIGEAQALHHHLIQQQTDPNRKADIKNTIGMFEEFMDYAFLGKREAKQWKVTLGGREIDMTKAARMLLGFVKFRNLAFSPFVAATSYFNSEIQAQIEKNVGEFLHRDSMALGTKWFMKHGGESALEIGKTFSTGVVNVAMETFGLSEATRRLQDAKYGRSARVLKGLGMDIHGATAYPIVPRVMAAVLYDHRFVNGRIMNFNQFKLDLQTKDNSVTNRQARREWKQFEDKAVLNYMNHDNNVFEFNKSILKDSELLSDSFRNSEYLREMMDTMSTRIKASVTQVEQLLTPTQRVAAQRHYALNYLMTHQSWFTIMTSSRFKRQHYDTSTGQIEEGSYRAFARTVSQSLKNFASQRNLNAFKSIWRGEDLLTDSRYSSDGKSLNSLGIQERELRKRALRRVAIDTGFLIGLAGIAYGLAYLADEDEDNIPLQFSTFVMERTLNQLVTTQSAIGMQMYETLKSPFVGLSVVRDMAMLPFNVFNNEEIQGGKYQGETYRKAYMKKLVPGWRQIDDFSKLGESRAGYWYHNKQNIMFSPVGLLELAIPHEQRGGKLRLQQ